MRKSNIKDLTGMRFGLLEVLAFSHLDDKKQAHWWCICECDADRPLEERNLFVKKSKYLLAGDTKSCGCLKQKHLAEIKSNPNNANKKRAKKEEYSKPFYRALKNIWNTMINRCHNPNYKGYKNYGAKGIYVCDGWRNDFWLFYNWSIENGYQKGYSLDRLGNNYNPDSSEWVNKDINCGSTKNGTQITIRKKTQTADAWAREPECEVTASTIKARWDKGIRGNKLIENRQLIKDKKVAIGNEIMTLEEWAEYAQISIYAIKARYRRGLRGADLIEPSKSKNNFAS